MQLLTVPRWQINVRFNKLDSSDLAKLLKTIIHLFSEHFILHNELTVIELPCIFIHIKAVDNCSSFLIICIKASLKNMNKMLHRETIDINSFCFAYLSSQRPTKCYEISAHYPPSDCTQNRHTCSYVTGNYINKYRVINVKCLL